MWPVGARSHKQGPRGSTCPPPWKYCKMLFVLQMLSKVSDEVLCIIMRKCRQLLGVLPPNPHRGSTPGPRWRTSIFQTPHCPPLEKILQPMVRPGCSTATMDSFCAVYCNVLIFRSLNFSHVAIVSVVRYFSFGNNSAGFTSHCARRLAALDRLALTVQVAAPPAGYLCVDMCQPLW